jgi:benzaldehyde dehydrogenase (NAD)
MSATSKNTQVKSGATPLPGDEKHGNRKKLFELDRIRGKIYSNGWVDGDNTVDVIEPATGATLLQVGVGSAATVAKAAKSAAEAQKKWERVPPEEKRKLFIRAEQVIAK